MRLIFLPLGFAFFAPFLLTACGDKAQIQAVENQLAELRVKPQGQIDSLPVFTSLVTTSYTPQSRDPFLPIKTTNKSTDITGPDLNRLPSSLEAWDLDELAFRGSMQRSNNLRALIITPNKQLISVTQGDYMGKNHGIITHLDKNSITLVELIPSGNEWQERQQIINLSR